jgi:hypothetical protein
MVPDTDTGAATFPGVYLQEKLVPPAEEVKREGELTALDQPLMISICREYRGKAVPNVLSWA